MTPTTNTAAAIALPMLPTKPVICDVRLLGLVGLLGLICPRCGPPL